MMKPRALILTVFILFGLQSFGQSYCDTLAPSITKQYDGYTQKQFDKLKRKKKLDPLTAFNVANYLRHKSDTTYKQWYELTINLFISQYSNSHSHQYKPSIPCAAFIIGQAYYFLGDHKNARGWFMKAQKAQCAEPCLEYYQAQTMLKQKQVH